MTYLIRPQTSRLKDRYACRSCTPGDAQLNYGCANPRRMRFLQVVALPSQKRSGRVAFPPLLMKVDVPYAIAKYNTGNLYPQPGLTSS